MDERVPLKGWRTWGNSEFCDHCCWGDRCDDRTHLDRSKCPYCLSTGRALWLLPQYRDTQDEV